MLPLNRAQIPALFKEARALETDGQLDRARKLYATILKIDPKSAPARFQLGQVDYKLGHYDAALAHLERAERLAPGEKAIWGLEAKALQRIDDPARAQAFLLRAKKARLDPAYLVTLQEALAGTRSKSTTSVGSAPPDKIQAAIATLQGGDPAKAAKMADALRRAHPEVAIVADILANALAALGRYDEAEAQFRATVALDPNYAEGHSNYGRFLIERGRPEAAIAELTKALAIAPKMAAALRHLGLAHSRMGNAAAAATTAFRKALQLEPDNPATLLEYGRFLMIERHHDQAIATLTRALDKGADEIDARLCLARALGGAGREDAALVEIEKVFALDPDCAPAFSARGSVYQTLGQFDAARADFREAIARMPRSGENYRVYLLSEKLAADDPLIPRMEAVFADPDLGEADRMSLGFALAKALEDSKQYDKVFTYLRPANALMRKAYPYDIDRRRAALEEIKDRFRGHDLQARTVTGASDFAPIFVTGLPRSGTTLVEQIVASHSTVAGGGELGYARAELGQMIAAADQSLRDWDDLTQDDLTACAGRIEERMRAQVPDAERITDKGVQSYTLIGPLRVVLPKARIVVVRRDPRDNLLSMYKNMFVAGKHRYSYDLRDLGRYYRLFEDIVGFWRQQVPGWFHEIRYEDLIADPETEARKLIDACGLEWEDRCLAFHENTRRVDTLSVHQVRQPIYKSSMRAWERYADELDEMFDALGGAYARPSAAE